PKDERRAYAGRAADLIVRGGPTSAAAARLEALDELDFAQQVYEAADDPAEAARLAMKLEHFYRAAELYDEAGMTNEAAQARGEALLAAGKLAASAPAGEQGNVITKESKESLVKAAKQFESGGEARRAADLYSQAGEFDTAARLYEQAGAWRDA